MSSSNPVIIPAGEGSRHSVLSDTATIKIRGSDTGGVFSQIETICGPHAGPPPHIHHREDETFFVIEGEFEFFCGGKRTTGGPGTIAHLPRGIAHCFRNLGDTPGRVLVTISPAGFENFLIEVGALTPEEQHDLPRLTAIATKYGIEFVANA
jgi:quercetin dioxygenase-like cupin family protein